MKKTSLYFLLLLAASFLFSCDPDNPNGTTIEAGANPPKINIPKIGIVVSPFSGIVTPYDSAFKNFLEISPVRMTELKVTSSEGTHSGTNYIHFPLTLPEGREIKNVKIC